MTTPSGRHLILDFWGCSHELLNDAVSLERAIVEAAQASNVRIVERLVHSFLPQGVTALLLLEESHLSIHTWPEHGYAAVDFYTCGDGDPERAADVLRAALSATHVEERLLVRGVRAEVAS